MCQNKIFCYIPYNKMGIGRLFGRFYRTNGWVVANFLANEGLLLDQQPQQDGIVGKDTFVCKDSNKFSQMCACTVVFDIIQS